MDKIRSFSHQTFSSLKIRNYRLYFIGQAISLSGAWMQQIAQAWLVLNLTHSGTALGLITAVQFLPVLFLAPLGGVIADRFPKIRILYFTQITSAILALVLGVLVQTNQIQLWMVYVLAAALGLITAVDNPTRQTFIIEMVGTDHFRNAVSLNSTEFNLTRVIGPAIAGTLIATVGLGPCFIFNGFSYFPVVVVLYLMRQSELHLSETTNKVKGQLSEGFKYVRSNPLIRNTLIMMAIIGTLSYEFQVILPLFAQFTFHGGAASYAALTSAMGAGSVLGGLYAARRKHTTPSMLIYTASLFGGVILISSIMPTLNLAIYAMVLVGFFSINLANLGNVTIQLETTPEMRGRVMALWTVAFMGSTPIGGPIIGWIGQNLGPRWGLATGGLAAIAAAVLGLTTLSEEKILTIKRSLSIEKGEQQAESDRRIP